jgi:hypothetical protein
LVVIETNAGQAIAHLACEGKNYFFPDGASAGAVTAAGTFPFKKPLTHVVLDTIARWTLNDPIATADKNKGMPTEGLTTHHIFP